MCSVRQTCDQIKDNAFASKAGCRLNNTLCNLPTGDVSTIASVAALMDLFGSSGALMTAGERGVF